jgi:hypothetical protein
VYQGARKGAAAPQKSRVSASLRSIPPLSLRNGQALDFFHPFLNKQLSGLSEKDLTFHFSFVGYGVGLGSETRLTGTRLLEVRDTAAYIGVPDRGNRYYLERRLYQVFSQAVKGVSGREVDLQFLSLAPTFPRTATRVGL